MTALSSYSTGTVAVAADGTTVTGTSTLWLSAGNAKPGDFFQSGHFGTFITDVTDDTHLIIPPWPGATLSGAAYNIWKVSQQRIVGAAAAEDVDKIVGALNTSGYFVFVGPALTEPDPSLGEEGQFAFQPATGKMWEMSGGVWTYLGIYKAFQLKGAWDSGTAYTVGDVVTLSGSSYVCVLDHTNHTPPNTTYWQLLASKGDTGATGATGAAGTNGTNGAGYGGTSTTSRTIGAGSQVFTTQPGLAYQSGARVRASSAANTSNWMEGIATYSGTTLTINVDKTNGSGTLADWNFNVVGQPGAGDLSSANNLSDLSNAATAARNLGVDPYQRVNSCLDRIYQSKLYLAYRRVINAFADGYGASDGVDASSANYTVDATGKRVLPSSLFSRLSGGTPTAPLGGTAANINDNNTSTSITYTGTNLSAASINSRILGKIDYGSNQTITKIEAVGLSQSVGSNSGTGLYYSTDGTTWTQLGSNLPGTTTTPTTTAVTGSVTARYIAIILPAVDFTTANVTLQDLNGYISTSNNMTVVTAFQTADSSVSNGRVLIEFDNSASPTLNTDLTIEVTCNGGTNWAAATLSLTGTGQSGRKIAETADTACTPGTNFAARIKTLNNKSVPIHGTSLMVH